MIYIFLIIIIITILFNVINNLNKKKKIEYFESSTAPASSSSSWGKSSKDVKTENQGLTPNQQKQVKNISSAISKDTLTNLIQAQSPLLAGPPGPPGPTGPAGTTLIASGKLANKKDSFNEKNKIIPQFVVGRTEGTNPAASLCFMDQISPFTSYQHWQLDINNNLKNRFDNTCMTMSATDNKIYMDNCDPNNPNQKWTWDNTNRLISTSNSTNNILKCISTQQMENTHITSIPGCVGKNCIKSGKQNFLVVGDCKINDIQDNQVWGFI
jgi:hypothetical protein